MSVTNIWVGSWRPHTPRGPIAAHYSSPGPKYALPGATGINSHDPTKQKLPAFSFGTRHCQLRSDCSPGPRYLVPSNVTRVGRDGSPAYSLYGRTRDPQLFRTPGPDCYSTDQSGKSVYHCAPAYSISGRTKEFHNDQTPGPAAYLLPAVLGPRTVIKTTAPNYTLCGRNKIGSFHEDLQKTPGPGTYKVVDPCIYKYKPPHYSMTGRNIMPGDSTRKPGPGSHHPEQVTFTKVKAPSFTFGVRHSQYVAPFIEDVVERALKPVKNSDGA